MNSSKKYSLVNDLGFVKTGVNKFKNKKKYYSTGSIKGNTFTHEGYYTFENRPSRANREVMEGDILQARMMNTNKIILIDKKLDGSLFSTGFFQFRPRKELIIPKFLYYILSSKSFLDKKDRLCGGATQKAINDSSLKQIKVLLPSLLEQKNIIAKVDEAFEKIDKIINITKISLDESKKLLDNLLELLLYKSGQKTKKINFGDRNYLQIIDGDRGTNYPKKRDFQSKGHCVFLNTKNVLIDNFNFEVCQFISKEKDLLLRKGKLSRHDIVLTTRGTIGNLGYYSNDITFNNIRINSGMVTFRANEKVLNPFFLFKLLSSRIVKVQIENKKKGAAQLHIPIQSLSKIEVNIPISVEAQALIALNIEKTQLVAHKIIETNEKKILQFSNLKSAILAKELKLISDVA